MVAILSYATVTNQIAQLYRRLVRRVSYLEWSLKGICKINRA